MFEFVGNWETDTYYNPYEIVRYGVAYYIAMCYNINVVPGLLTSDIWKRML